MTSPSRDPFREKTPRPYRCQLRVLGADINFRSNDRRLLALAEDTFSGLPRHRLGSSVPELTIDLLLTESDSVAGHEPPPAPSMYSGEGLLVASINARTFAVLSVPQAYALIQVGSDMLAHSFELRYELLELTAYTLAARTLDLVPLHAAMLGLGQCGVLINGRSGAGKSLLCMASLAHGLSFLSDDSVSVSPDSLLATAGSAYMYLRQDALPLIGNPDVLETAGNSPVIRRRSGIDKIQLDIRNAAFAQPREPLKIKALINLSPDTGPKGVLLQSLDSRTALAELEMDQPYAAEAPQWSRLRDSLLAIPAFRMYRAGDPDESAEALVNLLIELSR